MSRVLITGCGGMLGKAVYETFSSRYKTLATDIDLNEPWLSPLDVRDIKAVEKTVETFDPDIILHLAALTDLEYCERNQENAWLTNALGTENVALQAKNRGSTLVYVSTAGIFDGEQDEYNDFDEPKPLSIYGKSKFHGEKFVQQNVPEHFIFRAGWMMGGGPEKDKKFINKVYKQIKAGAKELYVVDDKLGTPTYTNDFAKGILSALQTQNYGLYNQVCTGGGSRLDVAREFVKLLGLEEQVKVTKVDSNYFQQEYFAPRPRSEKLVNMKLNARGMNVMRDWQTCLAEYSKAYKADLENQEYARVVGG